MKQSAIAVTTSVVSANTLVRPETIEKMIRVAIAHELQGNLQGSELNFEVNAVSETVPLPSPKGDLALILKTLGLEGTVQIHLSPIHADFILPSAQLQISVKPIEDNRFDIRANWKITQLSAKSKELSILVPPGLFEQAFEIDSNPIRIGFSKNSAPIKLALHLEATFKNEGTTFELKSFKTNLNSAQGGPDLFAELGEFQVNGRPLELDLITNGQTLHASEPDIRLQFRQIEPELIAAIKTRLADSIQDQFLKLSKKIQERKPFKFSLQSNELLKNQDPHSTLYHLFHDLTLDLNFSYLQYLEKMRLFSAQISSYLCFEDQCLFNNGTSNQMTAEDLSPMLKTEGVGALIYESWLQNIIHSDQFQSRIRDEYQRTSKSPGTLLAPEGIRLHFNPEMNALIVVMNILIDIKKTAQLNQDFGAWLERQIGGAWEEIRGTGKLVRVPIEILIHLGDIKKDPDGKLKLILTPSFPFIQNGLVQNTYHYPDNTAQLTSLVKTKLLSMVKKQVDDLLKDILSPENEMSVPLDDLTHLQGYEILPKRVLITPHRGLLITAEMKE